MINREYKSIIVCEIGLNNYEIEAVKEADILKNVLPEALDAVKRLDLKQSVKLSIGKLELYINQNMTLSELMYIFDKEFLWETGMLAE